MIDARFGHVNLIARDWGARAVVGHAALSPRKRTSAEAPDMAGGGRAPA